MAARYRDPLEDVEAMCRDDRCTIEGLHPKHVVQENKRGRKAKKSITAVVTTQTTNDFPRVPKRGKTAFRGWQPCPNCRGSGSVGNAKCGGCTNGFVFNGVLFGPAPPKRGKR